MWYNSCVQVSYCFFYCYFYSVHSILCNVIWPVSNILPQIDSECMRMVSVKVRINMMVFIQYLPEYKIRIVSSFIIWNNGALPYKCAQRHVLYRYFPDNWRLWRGVILCAGLSYVRISVVDCMTVMKVGLGRLCLVGRCECRSYLDENCSVY